jgi:hypothetical protein
VGLKTSAQSLQQTAWNQIVTPLKEPILTELSCCFERLRTTRSESHAVADEARFQRARRAFGARRYTVTYRAR